ncbi:phage holin, partial [Staphylococcus aureus]|uniref:phage holin n=1 Tax=Staphylococcus aureus TaxID=1280 RepID=UPI0011550E01
MDIGTIVRTILLIVAWINQFLAIKHISPIQVDEVFISTVVTGIVSIWTWWKNNNFTNNLDFNKITNEAYIYRDIKPNRPSRNKLEPIMLIIVNDVDHPINERAQTVAEHENLE